MSSIIFSQKYRDTLTRALTGLNPNQQGFGAGEQFEIEGFRFLFRTMVQFAPSQIENGGLNGMIVCSYMVQPLPNNVEALHDKKFFNGYAEFKKTNINPNDLAQLDQELSEPVLAAVDEALDKFYSELSEAGMTEETVIFRSERFLTGRAKSDTPTIVLAK